MLITPYQLSITTDGSGNMLEEEVFHNMEPVPLGGFAGFWRRLGARLVDLMVHFALNAPAGMVFMAAIVLFRPELLANDLALGRLEHFAAEQPILFLASGLCSLLAYHVIAEMGGGGLGKLVFGLAVLKEGGLKPGPLNALVRNLTWPLEALCLGLPAGWCMHFSEKRQRWGDRLGHTMVVCRARLPQALQPNPLVWMGCLSAGMAAHVGLTVMWMWLIAV